MPTATITYQTCESSQIHSFGYDAASQTLGVKFHGRKGEPPSEYHYFGVPVEVADAFTKAESKGKAVGSMIRGVYAYAKQPDANGIVFGLTLAQSPKYTTSQKDGRIVVRATGKPIPDDEPIFIIRASDLSAEGALETYFQSIDMGTPHEHAVRLVIRAFEAFAAKHKDRMKEPDTEPSAAVLAAQRPPEQAQAVPPDARAQPDPAQQTMPNFVSAYKSAPHVQQVAAALTSRQVPPISDEMVREVAQAIWKSKAEVAHAVLRAFVAARDAQWSKT